MSERDNNHKSGPVEIHEARERLKYFLKAETKERLFCHPTAHPAQPTGFCLCDHSIGHTLGLSLRAIFMEMVLRLPFPRLKNQMLRWLGIKIGQNVYISAGVWIDPLLPQLLIIEDEVFIGLGAKIALHEFRLDEFRAGRVILRRRCMIGGFSLIGCGVEIGEGATVAGGAVVGRDVPPGATAIGNPARIMRNK